MRKTKENAALTRQALLDGALRCFDRKGIAGSTLDDIAKAANVTKGALYWHFNGKDAVVRAMRDTVSLPILDRADVALLRGGEGDPLARIESFLLGLLDSLANDVAMRTALTVMHFKCEYTGELEGQLENARANTRHIRDAYLKAYIDARRKGSLAAGIEPRAAATETMMFMAGMIRLWVLDPTAKGLRRDARAAVKAHVTAKRA
jgi:TetR/AcrR family acrAB operon transcriptional repressor